MNADLPSLAAFTLPNGSLCVRVPLTDRNGAIVHTGLMPLAHKPLCILTLNGAN